MVEPGRTRTLLAIDAGIKETGWAVFHLGKITSGAVITALSRRPTDNAFRVTHMIGCLDEVAVEWRPDEVSLSEPSGLHWPVASVELLHNALADWAFGRGLRIFKYSTEEVRLAIAGLPNASRKELSYAVMARLGLVGLSKTTHEWEAIAVGVYHLSKL